MRTVCWRLAAGSADIASVRYRCLIPTRYLTSRGVDARLSWGRNDPLAGSNPDVLVFVKAFGDEDRDLARRAVRRGVPVVLDVCDNVFATGYRATSPDNLREMARSATSVVTTGPALAEVLRRELGPGISLHEVADPVETLADVRFAERKIWSERVRNVRATPARDVVADLGRAVAGEVTRVATGLKPPRPHAGDSTLPQVIWFGNVGSLQPRFGLVNLVDIADQLVAASRSVPFRLLVVSGDPTAYDQQIAPLPLETAYAQWNRTGIFENLNDSAVAIVPNSRDEFSICKSANRAVSALAHGVPVVATRIPSMERLDGVVALDDFESGVVGYLREAPLAAEHVAGAQRVIDQSFSGELVARAWLDVLGGAAPPAY